MQMTALQDAMAQSGQTHESAPAKKPSMRIVYFMNSTLLFVNMKLRL